MAMKLSTGKVAFPIEFDNGDKDCIYFNPNDPNLSTRMEDFYNSITDRIKHIEDMDLSDDGTPENVSFLAKFRKFQEELYQDLDTAFGGEISHIIFKHCSPFAIVDGQYFILQFVEVIIPEIKKQRRKADAEVEKKMAKHLNKYR